MPSNRHWKKYFSVVLSLFVLSAIVILSFAPPAQSDPPRRSRQQTVKRAPASGQPATSSLRKDSVSQHRKFVDSRYSHNRSYPTRGHSIRSLPRDHRVFMHGHSRYYSAHGVWYRPYGGHYVVVAPPIGLFVPFLPFVYTTIWLHGMPYYYANETYYTQTPGGYVVVEPPQDAISEAPPDGERLDTFQDDRLFIYPRLNQSEDQQNFDRYDCHRWAVEQTRYDPAKIPPEVPPDQIMAAREDYRQEMIECLDSRGYTAR